MNSKKKYEEPDLTIISTLFSDVLLTNSSDMENGYGDAYDYSEYDEGDIELELD